MIMATKKPLNGRRGGRRNEIVGGVIEIRRKRYNILTTYMREEREENWKIIPDWTGNREGAILVVGNFNARTGREGGGWNEDEQERMSKDGCIDKEGEK